ncbi:peptidylprolyl isomerase [Pseudoroseomonas wenyumeiae]
MARVDGQEIRRSEVQAAIAELPPELRSAPESVLSPLVIDQMITQKALVAAARAQKLQDQPEVQARLKRAEEQELQQALLRQEIAPKLTDEALRARYARDIAGKPGEEEVHARHILVSSEEEAKKVEAEVRKPGADFAAIARTRSTGPGTEQGGDLGFFKKSDMVPEFAEAAFAMKPGEISKPVRSLRLARDQGRGPPHRRGTVLRGQPGDAAPGRLRRDGAGYRQPRPRCRQGGALQRGRHAARGGKARALVAGWRHAAAGPAPLKTLAVRHPARRPTLPREPNT